MGNKHKKKRGGKASADRETEKMPDGDNNETDDDLIKKSDYTPENDENQKKAGGSRRGTDVSGKDDSDENPDGDGGEFDGGDGAADDDLDRQTRQIIETGSVTIEHGQHLIHCLTIIGQVEGHFILPPQNKTTKYEHVIPQIVAIEEDKDIEGLLIILNTVGGDVEAGLAIAELVAGMKKPTVSLVLGGGHSIGVPLAVCARRSFIVPTATMTVHPVRMNGIVVGVPQTLSYFDRMQDRIISFVTANSHITARKFRQLMMATGELVMDIGTVLDGQAAVDAGLIDSLGGLSDAIRCLYDMIEHPDQPRAEKTRKKSVRSLRSEEARRHGRETPEIAAKGEEEHAPAHHRSV